MTTAVATLASAGGVTRLLTLREGQLACAASGGAPVALTRCCRSIESRRMKARRPAQLSGSRARPMATWLWLLLSICGTSALWSEERVGRRALQVHPTSLQNVSALCCILSTAPQALCTAYTDVTCSGVCWGCHSNSHRPRLHRLRACGHWTLMGTTTT